MKVDDSYAAEEWCLPPPFEGDWVDLQAGDASVLMARLSEASRADPAATARRVEAARVAKLDFHPGWMLCEAQTRDHALPPAANRNGDASAGAGSNRCIRSYLYGPDGFTPLDGTAGAIHAHNAGHGIDLSGDGQRRAYLRFFCYFVRGEEGPFEIHESGKRLDTTGISPADAGPKLGDVLGPIRARDDADAEEGAHDYSACVLYGSHLFDARFRMQATGTIEMLHEELIGDNVRRVPAVVFAGNTRFPLQAPDTSGGGAS